MGSRASYPYGPYTHDLNKGGLEDILREQQLISTPDWVGVDGVRARQMELEKLSVRRDAAIEFWSKEPPTYEHPTNGEVYWELEDGERLDILVTRVKDENGSISTRKNP
jgi:hypothetical protein